MLGEQRQHVVEKADAGGDIRLAASIDIERKLNIGFRGLSVDGCCTSHSEVTQARVRCCYLNLALARWSGEQRSRRTSGMTRRPAEEFRPGPNFRYNRLRPPAA